MRSRQTDYKAAALQSKRSGDISTALQFLKVVKQFDVVIKMCEDGQEVDLSDMPPPPAEFLEFLKKMQEEAAAEAVAEPTAAPEPTPVAPAPVLAAATNMLEALQQRLEKYQSVEAAAKAENNSGKARRFGRIVKQYEDAIKLYKAGKPVPYDELPVPPGFGPLPTADAAPVAPTPSLPTSPTSPPPTASTPQECGSFQKSF